MKKNQRKGNSWSLLINIFGHIILNFIWNLFFAFDCRTWAWTSTTSFRFVLSGFSYCFRFTSCFWYSTRWRTWFCHWLLNIVVNSLKICTWTRPWCCGSALWIEKIIKNQEEIKECFEISLTWASTQCRFSSSARCWSSLSLVHYWNYKFWLKIWKDKKFDPISLKVELKMKRKFSFIESKIYWDNFFFYFLKPYYTPVLINKNNNKWINMH